MSEQHALHALLTALAAAGIEPTSAPAHGVAEALGVPPRQNPMTAPGVQVYGSWFTVDREARTVLVYAVVPGRFVRYEYTDQGAMTISVPLSRVSCVTETVTSTDTDTGSVRVRAVTVELDAQAAVTAQEGQSGPSAQEPGVMLSRSVARTERAQYVLTARVDDPAQPMSEPMLATLAHVLRLTARS